MSWYDPDQEDNTIYKVVVNDEEQYSIWPVDRNNPLGWKDVGVSGMKEECLAYIEEVWTDMRPLSLRQKMEEAAKSPPPASAPGQSMKRQGDDIVKRLSEGNHPVAVSIRPEQNASALKERIDLGYVHLKFTETRGGTELGVRLDQQRVDVSKADFETPAGTVHLEGGLTLNYVKVRCIADIDLKTLTGRGHLEPVEA